MTNDTTLSATAFAAEFASATQDDWRRAAEAALKGRPVDQALAHRTLDGLSIDAIAKRRTPRPIAGRPAGARWIAMTRIDLADPTEANAQALEDLNNGASGLSLAFAAAGDGDGLAAGTLDRLDAALEGVMLDLAPIHLDPPAFEGRAYAALAAALVERRGLPPVDVQILFGIDLLRDLARTGTLPKSWSEMGKRFAGVVTALRARGFTSPIGLIDARVPHCAGASDVQELAISLASATDHVRALAGAGVDVETAADALAFAFACDADQFASIAKLRAARLLWAAWRRETGLPDRPVHIHAETSRRMMTRREPHTNLVRTTIAAFSAGVGGADSLTVLPFTHALDGADRDGRRLARNAQAIILEEANAHRVADPAAGAGAIEALTDAFAARAWSLFQDIEREGGLFEAMTNGSIQARIAETRALRAAAIATRKAPIVGVSEFPHAGPAPVAFVRAEGPGPAPAAKPLGVVLGEDPAAFESMATALSQGASVADLRAASRPQPTASATPLDLDRLATPFEHLRAANESAAAPPAAFLALLGPIARHAARAGFMRNLLVAGGVAAIDGPVAAQPEATGDAFAASGARLAVLCGADGDYAEHGAAATCALIAQGAIVWLAGRPREGRAALEAAGVARFVAAGDDALDTLRAASALGGARGQPRSGALS